MTLLPERANSESLGGMTARSAAPVRKRTSVCRKRTSGRDRSSVDAVFW
jgi:hypothetical protein